MKPIRVMLVDDHSIVREGLRMIIENDNGIHVVGETANMADTLKMAESEKPDIVLLDLILGSESSLDHIPALCSAAGVSCRVLVLTGIIDDEIHKSAIQKGAHGILLKNQAGSTLLKAIRKVHQGEVWIDRALTAKLLADAQKKENPNSEEQTRIGSLTKREREIVGLIAEGLPNKEIGKRLYISEKTVRNSLTVIYSKLGIGNRLTLSIYASHHGLDKTPASVSHHSTGKIQ